MRNWREAGDDQHVFEEAEVVVASRNMRCKKKPSSHQEILAVAEAYVRPGTATLLTRSVQVSQTKSCKSRSCNCEKLKCQLERGLLVDCNRAGSMI